MRWKSYKKRAVSGACYSALRSDKIPAMDYSRLPTEKQNPKTERLDVLSIAEILHVIDREDQSVPKAVRRVNSKIARASEIIVRCLKKGGRLFFVGAGTSGRLGVLEAAECPPTFNTPPSLVQAIMAGGRQAVFRSKEGAEDNELKAKRQIAKKVKPNDVVVGISASGVTGFVRSALREARKRGARTIAVACNFSSPIGSLADVVIAPRVGPEVIAGSTRLKAATATKLILNRLTVASMVRLGKVYGNLMVDLQPRSKKLRDRGLRILKKLGGLTGQKAQSIFRKSEGQLKAAILMARKNLSRRQALLRLKQNKGFLRKALR